MEPEGTQLLLKKVTTSKMLVFLKNWDLALFFEDSKDKENGPRALEKFCASVTQNGVKWPFLFMPWLASLLEEKCKKCNTLDAYNVSVLEKSKRRMVFDESSIIKVHYHFQNEILLLPLFRLRTLQK